VIKWYLERKWLPEILIFISLCALLVSIDAGIQGTVAALPGAAICASVIFTRKLQWLAVVLVILGTGLEIFLGLAPIVSGAAAGVSLIFIAAFASKLVRRVSVVAISVAGVLLAYAAIVLTPESFMVYGVNLSQGNLQIFAFLLATAAIAAVNTLAWVFGRLTITRAIHVGSDTDRALLLHRQASLGLEVAKQTERLGIARDLTDLLVQRLTAVVSLSDGAKYLASADPDSALRAISRIADSSTSAQSELRKLYDLLHEGHELLAAPPSLAELPDLVVAMRQLGFNVSLNVDGVPFGVNEGAELCIFKIVFESLENVKKNTPSDTDTAVNFYWTDNGVQILIKDNGIETRRRAGLTAEQLLEGYGVADDLAALTSIVDGATLSALRERAALYEGSIEISQVAGVGYTVSAFFPQLRQVAGA
jgi:signal transduction histidine kinase